jgi:hypothetical protein
MESKILNKDEAKDEFGTLWIELLLLPASIIMDYVFVQVGILLLSGLPYTTDLFGKIFLIIWAIICFGIVAWSIPDDIGTIIKLIKLYKIVHNKK